MASPTTDRRLGLVGNTALKAPCDLATTANITLSGEQSIDGTTTSSSRVFVKNQTTTANNGIYDTSSGSWTRARDFDGPYDIVTGTIITVTGGSANSHTAWLVTNTGTITIGTTGLTFASAVFSDASSVGFLQAGTGAVARTLQSKNRDAVSVFDFLTSAQIADVQSYGYTLDVTTGVQAAITYGQSSGLAIRAPAGGYKITSGLSITDDIEFRGDGGFRSIFKLVSAAVVKALTVALPDNSSFIGGNIGGFGIICNGGAAVCDGLAITTTATNSAVSQSAFDDLYISNPRDGVTLDGVIYMCDFSGITVTGVVTRYGWYADSAKEVIYNAFSDLEVTGCANAAYAYWIHSAASQFRNLTADGCCYFANAYGAVKGLSIEGMPNTAASTYAIQLNQCQSLENVAIINVPNAKCAYGIDVIGNAVNINNVRCPDSGAGNQPNRLFDLHAAGTGTISNIQMGRAITNKLEAYLSDAILNGYVITSATDITARGSSYEELTWTPTFTAPNGWTTAATTISATYIKIGRMVCVTVYAQNGVCTAGAQIGGLPFTARSTSASAAYGGESSAALNLSGSIIPSGTTITNIPALTLTGLFWQMSATYFI